MACLFWFLGGKPSPCLYKVKIAIVNLDFVDLSGWRLAVWTEFDTSAGKAILLIIAVMASIGFFLGV
jgi:hypothetical protein